MCCIDLTESRLALRRRVRGVGELPLREEDERVRVRENIVRENCGVGGVAIELS